MGLGEVYEDKGLYKEAIDEYKKVIEPDAKHTGALYNLALVYEKLDPREAIAQWERYIASPRRCPPRRTGSTSPGSTSRSSGTNSRSERPGGGGRGPCQRDGSPRGPAGVWA